MRYAGGIEKAKNVLDDLMDSYAAAMRMACMFPPHSANRSFYTGKAQAFEDAAVKVASLIAGDGYDDKWYFKEGDGPDSDD